MIVIMIVKKLQNCLFEKAVKHILVVANLTPARLQVANKYVYPQSFPKYFHTVLL